MGGTAREALERFTKHIRIFLQDDTHRRFTIAGMIAALVIIGFWIIYGHGPIGILILYALGAVSMIYKRRVKGLPIGLEFVTIGTVIVSIAHGPGPGALFGFFTAVSAQAVANDYDAGMIFFFTAETMIGAVAGLIPLPGIIVMALMSLLHSLFVDFVDLTTGNIEQRMVCVSYLITHLIISVGLWNPIGSIMVQFVK